MVEEATVENFANAVETARTIHEQSPAQVGDVYGADLLDRGLALVTAW